MTEWIRTDTDWPEHRRLESANAGEVAFWMACLAYCGRNETDGELTASAIKLVRFWSKVRVDRLIEMGLLHQQSSGSYSMRDYLDHQDSKATIEAARAASRARVQRYRNARSNAVTAEAGNGMGNATTLPNPVLNPTVVEGPGLVADKPHRTTGGSNGKAWPSDGLPFPMRERWVSDRVLRTFVDADIPTLIAAWKASNDLRDSGAKIEAAHDPRRYALAIAGRVGA